MIFDGDRDELVRYVREMADMMGLRDWMVGIADDPPPDDANAQVDVPFGRRCAMIRFSSAWSNRDPEELRQTVAHELVHCHIWSLEQRICDIASLVGSDTRNLAENVYRETMELAVDAIATAWAETLPLPVKEAEQEGEAA